MQKVISHGYFPKLKCISKGVLLAVFFSGNLAAQQSGPVQTIRGRVTDAASGAAIPAVAVTLSGPKQMATTTDKDGAFAFQRVPVGRHNLQVSGMGYEPVALAAIRLTSAKEVVLDIQLKERVEQLHEVVIRAEVNKSAPLNTMALSGARMLSVEEASRFAGGMDDPARLVSAFAGVASGVATNGISVHGNAPGLLQWRLEGIEIPNPNHFADVASLGGGVLSSLSSHVLGNSDFLSGAFPAEYNNAISGVFDMQLRNGNKEQFQHTLQAGMLGLDVASEGPLIRKHNASYLFNYRYSTTGLLNNLSPADDLEQLMDYQDLNFKVHFPTEKAGVFSVWGTALTDKIKPEIEAPEAWEYQEDARDSRMKQTSGAAGISHSYLFGDKGLLKTTLATTYAKTAAWEDVYNLDMVASPELDFKSRYTQFVLSSSFSRKYRSKHTNKTGFTITNMQYAMQFDLAPFAAMPLDRIAEGKGSTNLLSAYSSSLFQLNDRIAATLGINGQLLTLNNSWTIEPRAAIKWKASSKSSFSLAYGMHSRMEKLDVYFVKTPATGEALVNKNLDFAKTHHLALAYYFAVSDNSRLSVEPYFQYLYNVPVEEGSPYSLLNRNTFYVTDALVSKGNGRNYGVDLTFEKYMTKGLYYMLSGSVFNSEYTGGDGVWRPTRFNRNYIVNGLVGKEWAMGRHRQNVLSVNVRLTLQGGDRYSPVDETATLDHPDKATQYDESRAYSRQLAPVFLGHYTLSYRMNRKNVSHEFAIKGLNATGYREYAGHAYNLKKGVIEPRRLKNALFNIVYRFDF